MNWVPVKSRMLAAVAYSADWQQLYLRFRSGDIYCYRGVPVERYRGTARSRFQRRVRSEPHFQSLPVPANSFCDSHRELTDGLRRQVRDAESE